MNLALPIDPPSERKPISAGRLRKRSSHGFTRASSPAYAARMVFYAQPFFDTIDAAQNPSPPGPHSDRTDRTAEITMPENNGRTASPKKAASRRWSPVALPRIRHRIAEHLLDPDDSPVVVARDPLDSALLQLHRGHINAAELYWATPQMTALAEHASATLDTSIGSFADHRPSPCGLMVFDGGVGGDPDRPDEPVTRLDAVSWGPAPTGQTMLVMWVRGRRLKNVAASVGADLGDGVPPLIPYAIRGGAPQPPDEDETEERLKRFLESAWLLMKQPNLVDQKIEQPDKGTRRYYDRRKRPVPEVRVVNLRSAYRHSRAGTDPESPGREYRCRWIVKGHWRDQACGPGRRDRVKTWIREHPAGPPNAPLRPKDNVVNLWSR